MQARILSWDGKQGTISAADAVATFEFDDHACMSFKPEPGMDVFVHVVLSVGDEKRALLLRRTPDVARHDILIARAWAKTHGFAMFARLHARRLPARVKRRPVDVIRTFVDLPREALALVDPTAREEIVESLTDLTMFGDVSLGDFWPADSVEESGVPFDPCFVALGGADGDLLGLYVYPPAKQTPVVFGFHEEAPSFSWIAESAAHFQAVLRAKSRSAPEAGTPDPVVLKALTGVDRLARGKTDLARERWLVGTIHREGGLGKNATLVAELQELYDRLGWKAARAILDEAHAAAAANNVHEAWKKAEVAVMTDFDAQANALVVNHRY